MTVPRAGTVYRVTLVQGERQLPIAVDTALNGFSAPLYDPGWDNEATLEIVYRAE